MISKKERWFNILSFVNEEYIDESNPLKQSQEQKKKKIKDHKTENHSFVGKRVAISISAKKIFLFAASAGLLIAVLLVSIIIPNISKTPPIVDTGIESGFQYSKSGPLPSEFCAYKSDTNEFDMDSVSLTFFYGGVFSSDINQELEYGRNIPEFDVYFGNANNEPIYVIAHSNENFISEKYRCDIITDESQSVKISFSYSEKITIPKSLFSEEQGVIRFCISGMDVNEFSPVRRIITCIYINYDVIDEKVILSPWDGYRN